MKTTLLILISILLLSIPKAKAQSKLTTTDNVHYTITKDNVVTFTATITQIEDGGMFVIINGVMSYKVDSEGHVGNVQLINDPSPDGCIGNAISQCSREFWCSVICDHGLSPACILGWGIGCVTGALN